MAEAKTVATNKFGWVDLSSSDPAAARAFYSKLFGWDAEVIDDPAAGGYGMFKLGGKEVGGVGPLQNPQQPTAWTAYVLVADADAAATKAKAAGGTVLAEPFDVLEEGRMAILADPGGAVFGLWQPKKHTGWEVERVPNSVCWVENDSRNIDAARRFYTDVFGWVAKDSGLPGPGACTEVCSLGSSLDVGAQLRVVESELLLHRQESLVDGLLHRGRAHLGLDRLDAAGAELRQDARVHELVDRFGARLRAQHLVAGPLEE